MKLIRGLHNWRQTAPGCVATIGNFDGVHLGHQAIFAQLCEDAARLGLPSLVISFQPLPHEFFNAASQHQRVQSFRDRVHSIEACGIDQLLLLRFNQNLASQSANAFIQDTLLNKLGVKHLLVGDDFRFGAKRSGDIELLKKSASAGQFSVVSTPTVSIDSARISSTRVRTELQQGNCELAAKLLGRPHRISGRVIHGEKVGRQLGFPTANICLKTHRPLLRGVFAVEVFRLAQQHEKGKGFPAVANLGERPTVGGKKLLLEVHLLDQNLDLYDQHLAVDFHRYIRGEKKFASLDELKQAIADDADIARAFFKIPAVESMGQTKQ